MLDNEHFCMSVMVFVLLMKFFYCSVIIFSREI